MNGDLEKSDSPNSGSRWHRWNPHIHTPGTILNDQFKGKWNEYLKATDGATPAIRAIGVTDYYDTECYEQVCAAKRDGDLPGCDLIFPNVEMRLAYGNPKGNWVNLHLLVSPEETNHLDELRRFLRLLTFQAHGDVYSCCKEDLIRLGRKADPKLTEDIGARRWGSQQFKVSFEHLSQAFDKSDWAQKNLLVAVAAGKGDGMSSLQEAADTTLRREVEKFADVMFTSQPSQRDFWLGKGVCSVQQIEDQYRSLKPCMHGCDAHELAQVGKPEGQRYTWIKGDVSFDALRQACIDPGRAFVGELPPAGAPPSQVIESAEIKGANWIKTPKLSLNPGLVTIIGARGSGKTALADIIALGCNSLAEKLSRASFLNRARELVHGASVTLLWEGGEKANRDLSDRSERPTDYQKARYLSQQFVEDLCAADGVTDRLLEEIKRVIFKSHPPDAREGALEFEELLTLKAGRFREEREREEIALEEISERLGTELDKRAQVAVVEKQLEAKKKLIAGYVSDRAKLVTKADPKKVEKLNALNATAEVKRGILRAYKSTEQSLVGLQAEVGSVRRHRSPETLRQMKEKHRSSHLKDHEWGRFLLEFTGDVDGALTTNLTGIRDTIRRLVGTPPTPHDDLNLPYIQDGADSDLQPLSVVEVEIKRLEQLINIDRETANKFSALSGRITNEMAEMARLQESLTDCRGAKERSEQLVHERTDAYTRVFEAIKAEQDAMSELYQPLMTRLGKEKGTLGKLSFSVSRSVDVESWAAVGERLLDLRFKGPFKGRGTLRQLAEESLKEAWAEGYPKGASAAMAKFLEDNLEDMIDTKPKGSESVYREWCKRFAKWLYGTAHITIHYSIDYDGVDIRKLSPGTRGIVLLLLYLALDDEDDRPLIIDQPEENLDPKSIHDELVDLFIRAKGKRQVIMVTHNANLVVNTDADQVIIAEAGQHAPGKLPPISYHSGGLENPFIRKAVCDILEGGERAFLERARRLRVRWPR